MKASSSTSSILRLGGGGGESDSLASPRRSSPRGVTVVHHRALPSAYAAERLYLLSELQLHAAPPVYLKDETGGGGDESDTRTAETFPDPSLEEDELLLPEEEDLRDHPGEDSILLSPFAILYLVWKDDDDLTTDGAKDFCQHTLLPAVRKVRGYAVVSETSDATSTAQNDLSHPSTESFVAAATADVAAAAAAAAKNTVNTNQETLSSRDEDPTHDLNGNRDRESEPPRTRLYIVVDRVAPPPVASLSVWQQPFDYWQGGNNSHHGDDDQREQEHFAEQEALATELAKGVAADEELRVQCDGLTVGVTTSAAASPGLESCLKAIHVGSADRRAHGRDETDRQTLIGLVATSSNDLHGHDPEDTMAHSHSHHEHASTRSRRLDQSLVTAEWPAAGDLQAFAHRAHALWRHQHDLSPVATFLAAAAAKGPRQPVRRRRPVGGRRGDPHAVDQWIIDAMYQTVVVSVLVAYLIFHYRQDATELLRPLGW
jgi:hypothetical protein